ncbi:MAG: CTP synthase [Candidatus Nanohaloarchaea archaeon]|nr:CTP synthase [Candidatus Nanohaloarchaea archaeon]
MPRWIFVTGGVLSGLGKGLVSASIAKLLESRGLDIVPLKCDGYLNVDPGTMNPVEHGEVFVLQDGGEVDMDFGHYERFLDVEGHASWNLTSGKIFKSVIDRERQGDYLGETVQMVPHVTNEIRDRFQEIAEEQDADVVIVEIGGTVGDIENMTYLEAVRQMREGDDPSVLVHLTLVPYLETVGEQKTKPTQHSVKALREAGLSPDVIVGRSDERLAESTKEKIALFCDVDEEAVVSDPDIDNIYRLPLIMAEEDADTQIAELLDIDGDRDIEQWAELVDNMEQPDDTVRIAVCGKYTDIDDSYVSVEEALRHAGAHRSTGVETELIDTEQIQDLDDAEAVLAGFDGVVIPGGFGSRGIEGKVTVARYCREEGLPLLGICLGMQMMIVEHARNVCGLDGANSTEVDGETDHPVIDILPEQEDTEAKGGTMRLGASEAELEPGSQVSELYGSETATERHRHRYEVNPAYHDRVEEGGLAISGTSDGGRLAEYIELPDHPFFIGTQAHPEFRSRLEAPNPLYQGLIDAAR